MQPSSLSLNGTGASNALKFLAQETGYTGAFGESDTCSGVATISPTTASGPSQSYTVTGIAAGTCSATISDAFAQKGSVAITVTTGNFIISAHRRTH